MENIDSSKLWLEWVYFHILSLSFYSLCVSQFLNISSLICSDSELPQF